MPETTNDAAVTPLKVAEMLKRDALEEMAELLGFGSESCPLPAAAFPTWGIPDELAESTQLTTMSGSSASRLVIARGRTEPAMARRTMFAVHRHNPADTVLWWWSDEREVTAAFVDRRPDGRPLIRRMVTDRHAPDAVGLRQWAELQVHDLAHPDCTDVHESTRRHIRDVLRQDGLTKEFFRGFRDALELLQTQMEHGPQDERLRHDVALTTLLRLVFVYFLQKKGALDGDPRFVVRQRRLAATESRSFYTTVLRPLFFGALNTPVADRSEAVRRLGDFPFLNGGLFEAIPAETTVPDLDWPDDVWVSIVDELLERYHFAIDEASSDDERRAVDPEMLGKVFEGLMFGESRHTSGSYYTPRHVVRRMVEHALEGHLRAETELDDAAIDALFSGDADSLSDPERTTATAALADVTILDPAVGTGAFLLETLHVLTTCRRALTGAPVDFETTRDLVHRHLFGVDIQVTAVRLCELRLWVALLATLPDGVTDELPSLPNLSHRICVGNSLLEPADLAGLSTGDRGATWIGSGTYSVRAETRKTLVDLQRQYLTTHGREKAKLRERMEAVEAELQVELLHAREERLEAYLTPLERLRDSTDLFGESMALKPGQHRERERLIRELEAVREHLKDLRQGREGHVSFGYWTRFADVTARGGFDIIVTNPPWVRTHRIDAATRDLLRARYRSTDTGLWNGARDLGIRAPFGSQVDLSAVFLERSIELLRPGGHLAALVPSKLFRSLHGSRLRTLLLEHDIEALEDCSDADEAMFEATTYPAVLHLRTRSSETTSERRRPSRRPRGRRRATVTVWHGDHSTAWEEEPGDFPAIGASGGEPWLLVEPEVREVFDRMWQNSTPLGEVDRLRPMRGIFTGCNDVFVRSPGEFDRLVGEQVREFVRPVLAGRDLSSTPPEPSREILWLYDGCDPMDDAPPAVAAYFEENEERLRGRADDDPTAPPWQVFRLREEVFRHKVVWRDIAPHLQTYVVGPDVIPMNTVYFLPLGDEREAEAIASVLDSVPMKAFAYALGERARGGWRRHFAWVMRMLPIPDAPEGFDLDPEDLELLERWFASVSPLDEVAA